jgi:hypothetical protein
LWQGEFLQQSEHADKRPCPVPRRVGHLQSSTEEVEALGQVPVLQGPRVVETTGLPAVHGCR